MNRTGGGRRMKFFLFIYFFKIKTDRTKAVQERNKALDILQFPRKRDGRRRRADTQTNGRTATKTEDDCYFTPRRRPEGRGGNL